MTCCSPSAGRTGAGSYIARPSSERAAKSSQTLRRPVEIVPAIHARILGVKAGNRPSDVLRRQIGRRLVERLATSQRPEILQAAAHLDQRNGRAAFSARQRRPSPGHRRRVRAGPWRTSAMRTTRPPRRPSASSSTPVTRRWHSCSAGPGGPLATAREPSARSATPRTSNRPWCPRTSRWRRRTSLGQPALAIQALESGSASPARLTRAAGHARRTPRRGTRANEQHPSGPSARKETKCCWLPSFLLRHRLGPRRRPRRFGSSPPRRSSSTWQERRQGVTGRQILVVA